MPLGMEEYDKLFCLNGKKYGVKKLILKAVASVESDFRERAYRFEPAFWNRYMRGKPEWDKWKNEINRASASYGMMQLMYPTAVMLGYGGEPEDLYDPVVNIELGAKLLRWNLDRLTVNATSRLWPIEIALARYNGGVYMNPDDNDKLKNQKYVDKVFRRWWEYRKTEKECNDE